MCSNGLKQLLAIGRHLRRTFRCYSKSASNAGVDNLENKQKFKRLLKIGPDFKSFFQSDEPPVDTALNKSDVIPYLTDLTRPGQQRKVYFDVYGCQQNHGDTEIIWSILKSSDYSKTEVLEDADIVLMVTCAIRDGAETKVWNRLNYIKGIRGKRRRRGFDIKIGILGCMAERLKKKLLDIEKSVDIIAGPDSYKDLARLLAIADTNETAINVQLSLDETYADIMPVRLNPDSKNAYVSIMRGCDNMCTYCIVPFTRGRERSRPMASIRNEIEELSRQGIKEVTLLGQNVNSYRDITNASSSYIATKVVPGFKTVYKTKLGGVLFAELLDSVAAVDPEIRVRFTSPHPKDFPDEVLRVIRDRPNVCKNLHMPAQSGNTQVLERMRRGYTREAYVNLIKHVIEFIPDITFSSDFICGFCGETDDEFTDTLSLIDLIRYNTAFIYPYSMREKTTAHRRFTDDVPHAVKTSRVNILITAYRRHAAVLNSLRIGQHHLVLVEGVSKRSNCFMAGRNDNNVKVIFEQCELTNRIGYSDSTLIVPGDYIVVQIYGGNSQVLKGIPLFKTTLMDFHKHHRFTTEQLPYSQCQGKILG